MIAFDQVSKEFEGRTAVAPLTLAIQEKEIVALIGPSGCGKTTVLRLLLGLVSPDRGAITIEETPMIPASAADLRRGIGYVVQDGGLFPHLTNRGNILLVARELGWDRDRQAARLEELRALVHFPAEGLDRFPGEISGGQRQRVGLMRALMLQPRLLLLDEPMAALDPLVRAGLQDDLKRIFEESGATVLLVTHDMGEAAFLAHRIILMRDGHIVQDGTAEDLRARPAEPFVTDFLRAQRGWAA